MNARQFKETVDYVRSQKPNWFLTEDEHLATAEDISNTETTIGKRLPDQYAYFASTYRAGYFAFLNLYSLSPLNGGYISRNEDGNIVQQGITMPANFFPFSDDETGGYYGFVSDDSSYSNAVYFYDSSSDAQPESIHQDFFDFVVEKAFQPTHFGLKLPDC